MIGRGLVLLGLAASIGSASADEWLKSTAPPLKPLVNRMENDGDRLAHEYKISLRRAKRWLPRGDEAVLWSRIEDLQKALNRLENGVDGSRPLEVEQRADEVLRAWGRAREAARRVRTSPSVRERWNQLGAGMRELEIERRILVGRNRRFTAKPEDRWDPAKDPARHFTRVELDRLRTALLEAEDLSNRLKTSVRDLPATTRQQTPLGGASLRDAGLREAAFALERHLDALVQAWLSEGARLLQPDLELALSWARRVGSRLQVEPAGEEALVAWAELVPPLDELARLYVLEPLAAH